MQDCLDPGLCSSHYTQYTFMTYLLSVRFSLRKWPGDKIAGTWPQTSPTHLMFFVPHHLPRWPQTEQAPQETLSRVVVCGLTWFRGTIPPSPTQTTLSRSHYPHPLPTAEGNSHFISFSWAACKMPEAEYRFYLFLSPWGFAYVYFPVSKTLKDILPFFSPPGYLLQSCSQNNTSYKELVVDVACTLV